MVIRVSRTGDEFESVEGLQIVRGWIGLVSGLDLHGSLLRA